MHVSPQPDLNRDPIRHFWSLHETKRKGKIMIAAAAGEGAARSQPLHCSLSKPSRRSGEGWRPTDILNLYDYAISSSICWDGKFGSCNWKASRPSLWGPIFLVDNCLHLHHWQCWSVKFCCCILVVVFLCGAIIASLIAWTLQPVDSLTSSFFTVLSSRLSSPGPGELGFAIASSSSSPYFFVVLSSRLAPLHLVNRALRLHPCRRHHLSSQCCPRLVPPATGEAGFAVKWLSTNLFSIFCITFFACRVVMAESCSACCSTFLAHDGKQFVHSFLLVLDALSSEGGHSLLQSTTCTSQCKWSVFGMMGRGWTSPKTWFK